MTRLFAIPVALSFMACSLTMQKVPKMWTPREELSCSGYFAPIADTVASVTPLFALFLVALFNYEPPGQDRGFFDCGRGEDDFNPNYENCRRAITAVRFSAVFVSLPFIAVEGYKNAIKCSQAKREHREWSRHNDSRVDEQRRARKRERRLSELRAVCEPLLAAWRQERDPVKKTRILDDMPGECREFVMRREDAP